MHCFVLKNLGSAKHAPISPHFRTNKVAPKHEQFLLLFIHVWVQLWFDTISIKSDIYTLRHDVFVLLDISRTTCPLINFTSNISQIFLSIFLSLSEKKIPTNVLWTKFFICLCLYFMPGTQNEIQKVLLL